jgi:ribose transport system permease protein
VRVIQINKHALLLISILLFILVGLMIPNFLSLDNILNVIRQSSIIAIGAVAMTMVIIIRGIDLSTSGIISLCGMITGMLILQGVDVPFAIGIGLFVGMLLGIVSGFIIASIGVPAFIATLVMGQVAQGFALILNNGRSIGGFAESFVFIGNGAFLGIPLSDLIMIAFLLIGIFIMVKTRIGNHIYALGNNETVVKHEGIHVNKLKIFVFGFSGLCAAAAGILLSAQLDTAHPTQGEPFLLDSIAACIIGGVSLMGGSGKVINSVIGALVIGFLRNALNLLGVHPFIQNVLIGSIIITVVAISIFNRNKKIAAARVY